MDALRPKVKAAIRELLQDDLKDLRRDMKRTAEKLAKAHPNSESIKHDMTIAFM